MESMGQEEQRRRRQRQGRPRQRLQRPRLESRMGLTHPTVRGRPRQEVTHGRKDTPDISRDMAERTIPWAPAIRQGWPTGNSRDGPELACRRQDISLPDLACRRQDISLARILEIHMRLILRLHQDLDIQAQDLRQRRLGQSRRASRPS